MNDLFTLDDVGVLEQGDLSFIAERIAFLAFLYGYAGFDTEGLDDADLIAVITECISWLNETATDGTVSFVYSDDTVEIVEV